MQSEVEALKALNIPDAQKQAQDQQEANLALMRLDTSKAIPPLKRRETFGEVKGNRVGGHEAIIK